jgi:hypothetical protein
MDSFLFFGVQLMMGYFSYPVPEKCIWECAQPDVIGCLNYCKHALNLKS